MKIKRRYNNKILQKLPTRDYEAIAPYLKERELPLGKQLSNSGGPVEEMIFPISGIISVMVQSSEGKSAEIATMGYDGAIGMGVFMGKNAAFVSTVVQHAGRAVSLSSRHAREIFGNSEAFREIAITSFQLLLQQIAMRAYCNRHHSIEQQLCRWLLFCRDRLPSDVIMMTHEVIARTLGVRREGVAVAAKKLQELGCITYQRGKITIVNRNRLLERSCGCYDEITKAYKNEGFI